MKARVFIALCVLLFSGTAVADQLDDGWTAYNSGEYEKAYDLFSQAFRADPGNVNVNFALGEAARQKKKFSHAVFAYDRVLMAQPDHQNARYGKAQALLALGQEGEARDELAALLDLSLEPDLRQAVETDIKEIDKKSRELELKGKLTFSGFYDDNINYGPTDGTLVVPADQRDGAFGLEVGLKVSAEYDVGQKGDWLAMGDVSLLNSFLDSDSDQELLSVKARAGARRLRRRDVLELAVRAETVMYGHEDLVDIYGLGSAWLYAKTKDDYLITRAAIEYRDYDRREDADNARDSFYAEVGETWKHFFDNRKNSIALGVELFAEEADEDVNSNRGFRLKVDGERELLCGVIGYVGGRFRYAEYDDAVAAAPAFFLPPPAPLDEREDQRWDLIVGAKKQITKSWALDLRHQYVRNDSNIGTSDYNRHRTSLTATFDF